LPSNDLESDSAGVCEAFPEHSPTARSGMTPLCHSPLRSAQQRQEWRTRHRSGNYKVSGNITCLMGTLQWGRGCVAAETGTTGTGATADGALQWGRGCVAAETVVANRGERRAIVASMGPRLRSRGNKGGGKVSTKIS
jgi:hypothetical protein